MSQPLITVDFSLKILNFLGVINFHCKMNEISTFPLLCSSNFHDFSTFRLFVILRFSLSRSFVLGDSSAAILDPLGSHVAPIGSHLAPFGLSFWSLGTLWACMWFPLGYHLVPLGLIGSLLGTKVPHMGHI